MAHPTTEDEDLATPPHRSESRETVDTYEALKDGEEEQLDLDDDEDEDERAELEQELRDKRTRFEEDERRPEGHSPLTDTMSSDMDTFVPVMDDNQTTQKANAMDLRYQMMERKLERLEKRLEAYEGMQRKMAKDKTSSFRESTSGSGSSGGGADTQQLIEFFLTEMDKQNAVIAQMRANQRVLEQKLEESMRKTHRFHHEQLHRMTKFQEVVQLMNAEFVRGTMLREEEKALEKTSQDKKTKAVRRALDEQILDLKNETSHQRRRLEIKFEKKLVELATENQLLKAENLELRDEVTKLGQAARSTKRTVRVLSEEVIKLKRAVGAAPSPDVDEILRASNLFKSSHATNPPTSSPEVHPT